MKQIVSTIQKNMDIGNVMTATQNSVGLVSMKQMENGVSVGLRMDPELSM